MNTLIREPLNPSRCVNNPKRTNIVQWVYSSILLSWIFQCRPVRHCLYYTYGLKTRSPSFDSADARLNDYIHWLELSPYITFVLLCTWSHSSTARPAPNPVPSHNGHARRLNKSMEKIMPNDSPRPDFMIKLERQRSHCKQEVISIISLTWEQGGEGCITKSWVLYRWIGATEATTAIKPIEYLTHTLSLSKASLRGLDVLVTGAGGAVADVLELDSDIVRSVRVSAQARSSVD
jgi:hypothetical protein